MWRFNMRTAYTTGFADRLRGRHAAATPSCRDALAAPFAVRIGQVYAGSGGASCTCGVVRWLGGGALSWTPVLSGNRGWSLDSLSGCTRRLNLLPSRPTWNVFPGWREHWLRVCKVGRRTSDTLSLKTFPPLLQQPTYLTARGTSWHAALSVKRKRKWRLIKRDALAAPSRTLPGEMAGGLNHASFNFSANPQASDSHLRTEGLRSEGSGTSLPCCAQRWITVSLTCYAGHR